MGGLMENHAERGSRASRLMCSLLATMGVLVAAQSHAQAARDYISIVGSSTVYPFATVRETRLADADPARELTDHLQ